MLKALVLILEIGTAFAGFPSSSYRPATHLVSFDAKATSATVQTSPGTTISNANLTVGSGANRALVATLSFNNNNPSSVSCTWDVGGTNQSMTLIVNGVYSTTARSSLWGLIAPTSGNKTLTCSWTGNAEAYLSAVSWTGVNQTGGSTSFPDSAATNGASSSGSNTITSQVNDAAIDAFFTNTAPGTLTPTQTVVYNTSTASYMMGSTRAAGSSSVAFSWTYTGSSGGWADAATSIHAY